MIDFFTNQKFYEELINYLNSLFTKKITRFSNESEIPIPKDNLEIFAQQIYKRGIINAKNSKFNISNAFKKPNIVTKSLSEFTNLFENKKNTFYIIDSHVFNLYKKNLTFLTQQNCYFIEAKENLKNLCTIKQILTFISEEYEINLRLHATHSHVTCNDVSLSLKNIENIVLIGGGLTLDIGSFIASILQIKQFVLIPTTFLSTIDATVGGKTGVNFEDYGKNQIGSFYFCDEIIIVPEFLLTLPRKEIISGVCEALKHSWICGNFLENQQIFNIIYNDFFSLLDDKNNFGKFKSFIESNLITKLKIVEKDPYELLDTRSILNFGHTIGHAIESYSLNHPPLIPHGIAVAHGMKFIVESFKKTGFATDHFENSMTKHAESVMEFKKFLNKITDEFDFLEKDLLSDKFLNLISHDKKIKNSKIQFVFPEFGILSKI